MEPMIEFERVSMSFGEKIVLREVSFAVQKGETLAVIGPSGTGKSTVLRLIVGLLTPDDGQIRVAGQSTDGLDEDGWNVLRQSMGMVFQYSALFDFLDVGENVAFGLRRHTQKSEEEIQSIVAEKLGQVGRPGTERTWPAELSGGMKKRVGLARATALEPGILLYDETTAGLDPIMADTINELILQTGDRMGVTSIVVTHDMDSVFRVADRVALLYDGEIAAIGTLAEIKNNPHPVLQKFLQAHQEYRGKEGNK